MFVGLGNRVEVWDENNWQQRERYVQEHSGEMIEELAKNH
jgi:DNA-binding transcriptional regulator/RsmH inhibitor MraZ